MDKTRTPVRDGETALATARCHVCGERFEAPEEFTDLVIEGARDCALADAAWRSAVVAEQAGAVA